MVDPLGGKKGIIFVLSAPAGTGKTTLIHLLLEEFPSIVESISCTTRPPRAGEIDGVHYHFISDEEFDQRIQNGDFLEHATYMEYRYGTSRQFVTDQSGSGKHVFLVIDTQGALNVKTKIDAVYIFLSAPSMEELKRRLMERKTESEETITSRVDWAKHELEQISHYDYHIVNEELEIAYQALRSIVIAEGHRIQKEPS